MTKSNKLLLRWMCKHYNGFALQAQVAVERGDIWRTKTV